MALNTSEWTTAVEQKSNMKVYSENSLYIEVATDQIREIRNFMRTNLSASSF